MWRVFPVSVCVCRLHVRFDLDFFSPVAAVGKSNTDQNDKREKKEKKPTRLKIVLNFTAGDTNIHTLIYTKKNPARGTVSCSESWILAVSSRNHTFLIRRIPFEQNTDVAENSDAACFLQTKPVPHSNCDH